MIAIDLDTPTGTPFERPDFIGLVSGAQYKLDDADGVTEFALAVILDGTVWLFEMSQDDLVVLGRQISSVVGE